jgi:hypothetical protein
VQMAGSGPEMDSKSSFYYKDSNTGESQRHGVPWSFICLLTRKDQLPQSL